MRRFGRSATPRSSAGPTNSPTDSASERRSLPWLANWGFSCTGYGSRMRSSSRFRRRHRRSERHSQQLTTRIRRSRTTTWGMTSIKALEGQIARRTAHSVCQLEAPQADEKLNMHRLNEGPLKSANRSLSNAKSGAHELGNCEVMPIRKLSLDRTDRHIEPSYSNALDSAP